MVERQPNQPLPPPEKTQPQQGRAEGRKSLQGPTTVEGSEQPQFLPGLPISPQESPQPGSTLSRAVERTRDLYERKAWVFLPLSEAGQGNVTRASTVAVESSDPELKGKGPPKRRWHVGAEGGDLHGYGEDESPRTFENTSS
jgi:hypothetical protein